MKHLNAIRVDTVALGYKLVKELHLLESPNISPLMARRHCEGTHAFFFASSCRLSTCFSASVTCNPIESASFTWSSADSAIDPMSCEYAASSVLHTPSAPRLSSRPKGGWSVALACAGLCSHPTPSSARHQRRAQPPCAPCARSPSSRAPVAS